MVNMHVIGVACVIIITLFIVLNMLYKRTNHYNNSLYFNNRIIEEMPDELDFVSVGSGPSFYGIDITEIPINSFSLSRPPQSFKYDFRLLRYYIDRINEGAIVVVVVVCPLGFGHNNIYKNKGYNYRYYGVLPLSEIDTITPLYACLRTTFPLLFRPRDVLRILMDVKPFMKQDRELESIQWQKEADDMYRGWLTGANLKNLSDGSQVEIDEQQKAINEKINILRSELIFLSDYKTRPVIVIPPFSKEVSKEISEDFKKRFVDDNIKQANVVDAVVLDYWGDERFGHEDFNNAVFLNSRGAKKFTQILLEDINAEI